MLGPHQRDEQPLAAVCIDNGTEGVDEIEYLCEVTLPGPKYHYEEDVSVVLLRGGFQKQTDQLVDTYGADEQRIMVLDDEVLAIGYYLQLLEIHDVESEDTAQEGVQSCVPDLYEAYQTWLEDQTPRDRRLRLLDQAESDSEFHEFYTPVLSHGDARWREFGLDAKTQHRTERVMERTEANPKFCYKNARRIVEEYWEDSSVQYIEGIALPKHAARITGHAWVEYDGRVAEVTWPWHSPDPDGTGAVYYGVEVPREDIAAATADLSPEEDAGPLLLDVDDPSRLG